MADQFSDEEIAAIQAAHSHLVSSGDPRAAKVRAFMDSQVIPAAPQLHVPTMGQIEAQDPLSSPEKANELTFPGWALPTEGISLARGIPAMLGGAGARYVANQLGASRNTQDIATIAGGAAGAGLGGLSPLEAFQAIRHPFRTMGRGILKGMTPESTAASKSVRPLESPLGPGHTWSATRGSVQDPNFIPWPVSPPPPISPVTGEDFPGTVVHPDFNPPIVPPSNRPLPPYTQFESPLGGTPIEIPPSIQPEGGIHPRRVPPVQPTPVPPRTPPPYQQFESPLGNQTIEIPPSIKPEGGVHPRRVPPVQAPPPTATPPAAPQAGIPPVPGLEGVHPDYVKYVGPKGASMTQQTFSKDDTIGQYLAEKKNMSGADWMKLSIKDKDALIQEINKATGKQFKPISGKGGSQSRSMEDTVADIAKRADFHWNKPQQK